MLLSNHLARYGGNSLKTSLFLGQFILERGESLSLASLCSYPISKHRVSTVYSSFGRGKLSGSKQRDPIPEPPDPQGLRMVKHMTYGRLHHRMLLHYAKFLARGAGSFRYLAKIHPLIFGQ